MIEAYTSNSPPPIALPIGSSRKQHYSSNCQTCCVGLAGRISIAAQFPLGTSAIYLRIPGDDEAMIVGRRYFDNGLLRTFLAGDAWRSGAIVGGIGYEE